MLRMRSALLTDLSILSYTSIGVDNRPFCRGDAKGEELLPIDEILWESGVRTFSHCQHILVGANG